MQRLHAERLRGGDVSVCGAVGSSTTFLAGALWQLGSSPVLLVVPHLDDAEEAIEELADVGIRGAAFPALEVMPGETNPSADLVSARLDLMQALVDGEAIDIIVAPFPALMQGVPAPEVLAKVRRTVRVGDLLDVDELLAWLVANEWSRVQAVESPGEFAVRGGLIDLFPIGGTPPIRVDLFGDEIERIHEIDVATQANDRELQDAVILGATGDLLNEAAVPVMSLLPEGTTVVLAELAEIVEQGRGYWERVRNAAGVQGPPAVLANLRELSGALIDVNAFSTANAADRIVNFDPEVLPAFADALPEAMEELSVLASEYRVALCCSTDGEFERAKELLSEHATRCLGVEIEKRHVHRGFVFAQGDPPCVVVPFHELLNRFGVRRRTTALRTQSTRDEFMSIAPGDLVVHRDHGIARFLALRMLPRPEGGEDEVMTLEFSKKTFLHVPLGRIELVQRYVGAGAGKAKLSTLGGKRWKKQKEQVEGAVRDLASELLRVQAARAATPGIRFPADTLWQREFEAEFPFEETPDQLMAIAAIKHDMAQSRPMDRLICGDVGFGKTEVAIRAAFKAAEFGMQVAVLVPTTVLAEQHERTFRARFRAYPFRIESLSRFKTAGEQRVVLDELAAGRVDIIIGTHRLFSKDVEFSNLGLIVVDEEQRFGVEHKQRLLEMRTTADVLTLSATPIPRTLHMAMLGIRDISSLATPPLDRRAIVTEVIPWNDRRIKRAIERELARGGQVFYVHNRVYDIESVADEVQKLVPDANIIIGHGQMSPRKLERVMLTFVRGEADILVSTTIIESGVDIPTANTMFIDDAHRFGLADLHQLRGRVGRSRHRGYCYMLLPNDRRINDDGRRRLKAIEDYSMLGAGFRIAMQDLEIRGAGNLLGPEQSGHITAVGYDMYCQLLEHAVSDLSDVRHVSASETTVDIGLEGSVPKGFVPSDQRRMEAYRRIGSAQTLEGIDQVRKDLTDAYGAPPKAVMRLLEHAEIRLAAATVGVRSLVVRAPDVVIRTARPGELVAAFEGVNGTIRAVGVREKDGLQQVYFRPPKRYLEPASLAAVLRKRLLPMAKSSV